MLRNSSVRNSGLAPRPAAGRGARARLRTGGIARSLRIGATAARRRSAVEPADAGVLHRQVVLDAVFRALAADARFLDAAERRDLGRDQALVDADEPVFERLRDPEGAAEVAGVEIRGEPVFRVVRHPHRLGLVLEAEQRRERPEGLLARDRHLGRRAGDDRRLEEGVAERMAVAAGDDLAALLDRVGDVLLDLGDRLVVDQRALLHAVLEAVADLELSGRGGKPLGESIVDAVLDEEAVGADAGLAGVAVLRSDGAFDGAVEVGVVEDDEGGVAAELHRDLLHRLRRLLHQLLAALGRAGEGDLLDVRVRGQLGAYLARRAGDDVDDPLRDAGLGAQHAPGKARIGRQRRRLDHRGAAGGERRPELAGDHRGREVPRGDGGDDPDRVLGDEDAPAGPGRRDDVTVDAPRLLG